MFSPDEIKYQEDLKKKLARNKTVDGFWNDQFDLYAQHDADLVEISKVFRQKEPLAYWTRIGIESFPAEVKKELDKLPSEVKEFFASMPDREWRFPVWYDPWAFRLELRIGRSINGLSLMHTLEGELPTLFVYLNRNDVWDSECFWSKDIPENPGWFKDWWYSKHKTQKNDILNKLRQTFKTEPEELDFYPVPGIKSGEVYAHIDNVLGRQKLKDLDFWKAKR